MSVKGQKYNIEPKEKIKKVFNKVINTNKPMKYAVLEEYGTKTNQTQVKKTKSWQILLERTIPDSKLTKVLDEGLEATIKNKYPDYAVRHKYLETGLKVKNKFPDTKVDLDLDIDLKALILKINGTLDES